MRLFIGGLVVASLLVLASLFIFLSTGGTGLVRTVRYYLLADIDDKRYQWGDFVPNNTTKRVSGFYSSTFSRDDVVAIWTLGGLRTFKHKAGTSVYNHRNTCKLVRELKETSDKGGDGGERAILNPEAVYLNIADWQILMQQEYPVTIQWIEEDNDRVIDKLWSVSGKYKILGRVETGVCD
jgi:hypothetical protein